MAREARRSSSTLCHEMRCDVHAQAPSESPFGIPRRCCRGSTEKTQLQRNDSFTTPNSICVQGMLEPLAAIAVSPDRSGLSTQFMPFREAPADSHSCHLSQCTRRLPALSTNPRSAPISQGMTAPSRPPALNQGAPVPADAISAAECRACAFFPSRPAPPLAPSETPSGSLRRDSGAFLRDSSASVDRGRLLR